MIFQHETLYAWLCFSNDHMYDHKKMLTIKHLLFNVNGVLK